MQLEGFSGLRNGALDGGIRARIAFPFARVGIAADHSLGDHRTRPALTFVHPARRSGLFGDGTVLRLDATLGPDPGLALGLEKPIQRRIPPGATRPGRDFARLYSAATVVPAVPRTAGVSRALADARAAGVWIARMTIPWLDYDVPNGRRTEAAVTERVHALRRDLASVGSSGDALPRTVDTEARVFHAAVDRAFAGVLPAADSALARRVAARARAVILDEVLLPYDRLLGQVKRDDSTRGLALAARGIFLRWLHVESGVPPAAIAGALDVFVGILDVIDEGHAAVRAAWRDSRMEWLPLQLALRPEDHDTQAELDALVERATGARFTDGNFVSYVINEQFQVQLSRTIRQAEDYHILWIHDIRGIDDGGDPDEMTFRHVVRSYLAALTARVRAYDRTGKLPVYMILLDEWFYQVRRSRPWMDFLEDPAAHRMRLPRAHRAWGDTLAAAQAALQAAIDSSRLLQAQRRQFGDEWLRDLVKVHVNITNAADFSFWSRFVVRGVSIPDNILRDHRKLVFYDVTEADPYRGEAIVTGAGLGEHYTSQAWEDRAMLLRGPSALQLKGEARRLLLSQGMKPDRIPWHLQEHPRATDYDARVAAAVSDLRRPQRATGLHNATGYGDKDVNVGKAVLYSLMPAGSVIKVPDSLWNSAFWASTLAGSALRGCRVLVIAPSLANAPAPAFGSMEHAYGVLWRLLALGQRLAPELAERGGVLRVGIYTSRLRVHDIPGKLSAVRATFDRHEWLRQLFGFPPSVYPGLDTLVMTVRELAMSPELRPEFESEGQPKLHLKANALASREAWGVMSRPEWVDMTWEFIFQRIAQVQARAGAVALETFPDAMLDVGGAAVRRWFDSLSPAERERVVFYSIIGSHNQNERSFVMDGEDAFVVSGWPAVIPYLDLISIIGQSEWIEDPAALATYLPPQGPLVAWVSRWFRVAF